MRIGQNQSRTGSPVPKQPRLDVLRLELTFEQDVVFEEDHSGRDVVSGTTVLGDRLKLLRGERIGGLEVDMIFEDGIRKLRLSGWGVGTVEYLSWHCRDEGTDKRRVVGMSGRVPPDFNALYHQQGTTGQCGVSALDYIANP